MQIMACAWWFQHRSDGKLSGGAPLNNDGGQKVAVTMSSVPSRDTFHLTKKHVGRRHMFLWLTEV